MRQWAFVVLTACGPAAHPGTTAERPHDRVEIVAPSIPQADFVVAPAELGDRDAWMRIRHRVRVARRGMASFQPTGERVDNDGAANENELSEQPIYPVIGESGDKIRIVVPEDDARLAMWITRGDAATTTLAPVRVGDEHGRADATSGVWLGAGANLVAKPAAGGVRAVSLANPYVDATGFVPAAALGEVWVSGEREAYDPSLAFTSEPAPSATGTELAPGPIRVAPDGAVIATTKEILPVHGATPHGAWMEVDVHAVRVRVHGFVPASAVSTPTALHGLHGSGTGGGYGISDTDEVDVPAGACLYDRAGGDIVGVEDAPKRRYAGRDENGWRRVYVGTEWGLLNAFVKDTGGGKWEICTK